MDATTMPLTRSLLSSIQANYPHFTYQEGADFSWNPAKNTITFSQQHPSGDAQLLHELAHAILGHAKYSRDIELVALERDAWKHAQSSLAPEFSMSISDEDIESHLDTYRDWLHKRSLCPRCESTGIQQDDARYLCVVCQQIWRVNDARSCGLRRYKVANK